MYLTNKKCFKEFRMSKQLQRFKDIFNMPVLATRVSSCSISNHSSILLGNSKTPQYLYHFHTLTCLSLLLNQKGDLSLKITLSYFAFHATLLHHSYQFFWAVLMEKLFWRRVKTKSAASNLCTFHKLSVVSPVSHIICQKCTVLCIGFLVHCKI